MLTDFFRINLPYGIAKNESNEWMAFNREYMPLGYNNQDLKGLPGSSYLELPIYTKYKRLTNSFLSDLAHSESGIERNNKGDIVTVFLYNDKTNPINRTKNVKSLWDDYFEKIEKLSKLKT